MTSELSLELDRHIAQRRGRVRRAFLVGSINLRETRSAAVEAVPQRGRVTLRREPGGTWKLISRSSA